MHNTNRSSHVKTEVSFPSIYCSNEVLHFDPGGQEETVELLFTTLPRTLAAKIKQAHSLSLWHYHQKIIIKCGFIMHKEPYLSVYFLMVLCSQGFPLNT